MHYNVVDGKSGHRTQTPLNVMVHNNRPMQFAVDVHGNRFVTSIDGEEVDSFIDNTLAPGGVGFFSDAGERARLYWMRFPRNDDWLGHVCAMLAERPSAPAAELRQPAIPGDAPLPGLPGEGDGTTLVGGVDRDCRTCVPRGKHDFSKPGEVNHGIRKRKPDQRDAHAARRDGHHRPQEPEARQQDALQGRVPCTWRASSKAPRGCSPRRSKTANGTSGLYAALGPHPV